MSLRHILGLSAALLLSAAASAHEYKLGDLLIGHPYARATVPGQPSGGAYLSIETRAKRRQLIGVARQPPRSTEIHTMSMDGMS